MTQKSPTVLFFGNERLATGLTTDCPTFRALIAAGYTMVGLVLHNNAATSRKQRAVEIAAIAEENNIPIYHDLSNLPSADIGVLVAFGKIIPQSVIDLFPHGIINIHPSALPRHRGPIPLESVLLHGEPETKVSVMQLVKAMDAGPVYAQRSLLVPSTRTKQELANRVAVLGSEMITQHLPAIFNGTLVPQQQDDTQATYDQLITKKDGVIDWNLPAAVIERQIRAYAGWPKSTAQLGGHQFIVTQADVENTSGKPGDYLATKKSLTVYCGKNALAIRAVQPVNKKEMPIQAFLSGYSL